MKSGAKRLPSEDNESVMDPGGWASLPALVLQSILQLLPTTHLPTVREVTPALNLWLLALRSCKQTRRLQASL